MKAIGKREARRPWVTYFKSLAALKGRNTVNISALQALSFAAFRNQGRRASRLPLAIIFPRRWRSGSDLEQSLNALSGSSL